MKKKEKKKLTAKQRKRRTIAKIALLIGLNLFLVLCIVLYFRYGQRVLGYYSEAKLLVREAGLDSFRKSESSLVYDKNEKLISVLKGEKDVYYINYEDIPEQIKNAMVAIEDKKFNTHMGIDIKANIRAMVALVKNREIGQGGSTITQQLSRNIFLSHEVSLERKFKEIFISLELEKKYEKYQIMEFYLNNIYFANGYYGIQAASKGYFSKEVDKLSLGEIAFLCSVPNNPTLYDPLDNYDNTLKRKDRILYQMLLDKYITQEEYENACNEKITLKPRKMEKQNYIATYVYHTATRALMEAQGFAFRNEFDTEEEEKDYKQRYNDLYSQCQMSLFNSGYRIYTSIDLKKQKQLQKSVDETLKKFTDKSDEGVYKLQGASVCIDNKTGRVVAIVGGRSQEMSGYTLNRGYRAFRQPGSSIKPLVVYTPAFENGYTPDSIVEDKKIEGGPKNSDNQYWGRIPLRKAVEHSKNTVAWQIFKELTPKKGLGYILNMDFSMIVKRDYVLPAALGGLTHGASPVEMASGYAAIANDGVYREPTCIVRILDSKGNEVVGEDAQEKKIYKANAARMMTDVLTGVIIRGTGKGIGFEGMSMAAKTGTTNDKKDGWFVGYTPYYTTSVWVGYDIPKKLEDLYGSSYPGIIWKNYMEKIHEGLEDIGFEPYYQESVATPAPTPNVMKTEEPVEEETLPPVEEIPDPEEEEVYEEPEYEEEEDYQEGENTEEQTPDPLPDDQQVPADPTIPPQDEQQTQPIEDPNAGEQQSLYEGP